MATSLSRRYKPTTEKLLFTLSGNQCAAPGCDRQLVARDGMSIIGKICHIEAASPDGPRWNPDMTDDERRAFDNLVLLCDECHTIVDNRANEAKYPVALLRRWKHDHESARTYSIVVQRPSLLAVAINALAEADLDSDGNSGETPVSFDIAEKLRHNDVKRNHALIDEHKVLYTKVNSIYDALEEQGSFKKEKLLRNVRSLYLRIKGCYVKNAANPVPLVRRHADDIFDDVRDELLLLLQAQNVILEDVEFAVSVVMVDAFMRCKILERPPS